MNKLNFFGIGPKIAVVLLPWLGISIAASCMMKDHFRYTRVSANLVHIAGIVLMVAGLIFYISTARMLLKGLRESRLITTGTYAICQNPLYAALILFIIPALSLLLNSWLVLTTSLVGYILVRVFIASEYAELEKFFGEQYHKYRSETPEFFPLPLKKWMHG